MKQRTLFFRMQFTAAIFLPAFILFTFQPIWAQSDLQTEQLAQDVLLEKQVPTDMELQQLDLNQDGVVDVADLVQVDSMLPPIAGFVLPLSTIDESMGTARINVNFDRSFTGSLAYSVDGTPQNVSASGLTAEIAIPVADDWNIEDGKIMNITLAPSTDSPPHYYIGVPHEHTLYVSDNDVVWSGRLYVRGLSSGVDIEITENLNTYQATLKSDGYEGIPSGIWPATVQVGDSSFECEIGPIPIDPSDSLLNTDFNRTIVLRSNPATDPDHTFNPDVSISGSMSDTFVTLTPNQAHLNRTILGTFALIRGISGVPVYEAELTDTM